MKRCANKSFVRCLNAPSLAAGSVFVASVLLTPLTTANTGGLNAEGCHNVRKRGEYHCHGTPLNRVQVPPPTTSLLRGKDSATCGTKRYCKEMVNCAEAVHYLYSCGLKHLDSDRDGIPCETLCGNSQAGANQVERILRGGQ